MKQFTIQQRLYLRELKEGYPLWGVEVEAVQCLLEANDAVVVALRSLVKECPFVPSSTGVTAQITFAQIKAAQTALALVEQHDA